MNVIGGFLIFLYLNKIIFKSIYIVLEGFINFFCYYIYNLVLSYKIVYILIYVELVLVEYVLV